MVIAKRICLLSCYYESNCVSGMSISHKYTYSSLSSSVALLKRLVNGCFYLVSDLKVLMTKTSCMRRIQHHLREVPKQVSGYNQRGSKGAPVI